MMRRSGLLKGGSDPGAGEVRLSDAELSHIVRLVYERSGITLHSGKRALVLARLQKRLRAGGFASFRDYLAHVAADTSGAEITALLDAIATNHTSFFREPQHFEFLRSTIVPALARSPMRIWSAACSSGEEPVTIAITLLDALEAGHAVAHSNPSVGPLDQSARRCFVRCLQDGTRCRYSTGHAATALRTRTGCAGRAGACRGRMCGDSSSTASLNFLEASDLGERVRRDLLPQRHDLLRSRRSAARRLAARAASGPRRTPVHLPLRKPERYLSRPALGRAGHLSAGDHMNVSPSSYSLMPNSGTRIPDSGPRLPACQRSQCPDEVSVLSSASASSR